MLGIIVILKFYRCLRHFENDMFHLVSCAVRRHISLSLLPVLNTIIDLKFNILVCFLSMIPEQ